MYDVMLANAVNYTIHNMHLLWAVKSASSTRLPASEVTLLYPYQA